ncbi:DUF4148 domain-containing protein [Burkholderia sp. WSM2232]|uniref:DUF4148 domain-containing protein n=1 Tax=Burkholderia sp. WSM2232 TaxID=944436 RepID=UPI0003FEFB34|nr:DUF4148 domain-containing protein [Burkholderia sp. WSM2232]
MKQIMLLAALIAVTAPMESFAQSISHTTRAARHEELASLEKSGYNPSQSCPCYPADLQRAEQAAAQADVAEANAPSSVTISQLAR